MLQEYAKYLIGVTDKSLTTIKGVLQNLTVFLKFMEGHGYSPSSLSIDVFEEFLDYIEEEHSLGDRTFNRLCVCIRNLYDYLSLRKLAEPLTFDPCYYKKNALEIHHDRSVPPEIYQYTLRQLRHFPEELRLIYLHLLTTGLRISEVCTLRPENYQKVNEVCWLRVYQHKMKAEKMIPIPEILFDLMTAYIKKESLAPSDYVFRNTRGGPYKSGTFLVKMRQYCDQYGINKDGYMFQSHAFRHTMATLCHQNGMSLHAIRDYLGHTQTDMTKQYIDYIPERLLTLNNDYFKENTLMENSDHE